MLAAALLTFLCPLLSSDVDTDGDGLSDFHEVHKHRTDPARADSDGDGVPDGDWHERREFTYTVRAVIEVLRPVTPETLTDDFQDARVLVERDDRVQLEVVLYPYSTANEALGAVGAGASADRARWLEPGPTSDASPELGAAIRAALAADGVDAEDLGEPATVARVADWLCRHAQHRDGFTAFVTAFDGDGTPRIPAELRPHLEGDPAECWPRELSAHGMFTRGERGSCTSSAIYLSGCLRALGVPTRTILTTPLFDAGDEREWAMVRERIAASDVRRAFLGAMSGLENHWASHTMNEVLLGGRWWRLDYGELGVGILRPERFGLTVRVGTFHDWADARASETIGRRQTLKLRDAVLDGANPYSALVVDDAYGVHSTLEVPAWPVVRPDAAHDVVLRTPSRVTGTLVDPAGEPVRGRVALVWENGSRSVGTRGDGGFEIQRPNVRDLVLHGSTEDGRVAVARPTANGAATTLRLGAGARLDLTLRADRNLRCAVHHGGLRIEDFTLRSGETARTVVPPGEIRIAVGDGDGTRIERTLVVEAGSERAVELVAGQ